MPYDIFISYSRRDNVDGRITQLVDRIKTDFASFEGNNGRELVPFFDRDEIHGMQDWQQRILQGLRESRLLLVCFSPAYLKSEYCEWEFLEYQKREIGTLHGFNGVAPIYFVEVPGWTDKDFDQRCATWVAELRKRQHFDLRPWHDQGAEAMRETAVQERMGKLNRQIVETITRSERAEKSLGNVDAHNPHFIGRTTNLRLLREAFVKPGNIGVVTAVNGVGGLGKTALAIEYAHAFADEYGGGRWQVRCSGKDDLRLALAELATPIGFEFTDDEKKNADLLFERTRRELKKLADAREPHRCLLILDNVDRPSLLAPAQVARLNGGDWLHVLATTRLGENELHGAPRDRSFLAIDELPPDDALALIESYQPDGRFRSEAERVAAREIVRLLGSFTLAVESAAVYIGQFANAVTCAAFLTRLKKEGLDGLDAASADESVTVRHGEKRLSATLQPTLERLSAAEKLAMEYAAMLPPDQVPLPWLRVLVSVDFLEMEGSAEPGHPDPWKNVTRRLLGLRLLQRTENLDIDGQPRLVRVHRLVQELVLGGCRGTERGTRSTTIFLLMMERAGELTRTTRWEKIRWELDPIAAFAVFWQTRNRFKGEELLQFVANRFVELAEWSKAEPLLRRALAWAEMKYGPENLKVAICLNDLGMLLKDTNRLTEAEPLLRRALAIDETSFGPQHPNVGNDLNNLAQILNASKRRKEAEPLMRRALAISEANLGTDDPSIATELNNLGALLFQTNRQKEAEPLMRRSLTIVETHYGLEHPKIIILLNNLAQLLGTTKRRKEAEPLLRRALAIAESSYGPDHPQVAIELCNLGILLHDAHRSKEAGPMLQRSIDIFDQLRQSTGHDHPQAEHARRQSRIIQRSQSLAMRWLPIIIAILLGLMLQKWAPLIWRVFH